MRKRVIRLNESQLRQIVKESVKKVLNEQENDEQYAKYDKYINSDEWFGVDASNEISLFEYGMLIKDLCVNKYIIPYQRVNSWGFLLKNKIFATIIWIIQKKNIPLQRYLDAKSIEKAICSILELVSNKWSNKEIAFCDKII